MTPRIFPFIILLTVIILSCKDDDKSPAPSITGKWQGTLLTADVAISGVPTDTRNDSTFNAIVEFKTDGTVTITDDGQTSTGTWSQNGDKIDMSATFGTDRIDLSGTYTIKTLTDTKLVLYIDKDGSYTDPDTHITVQGNVKATLYFDRTS